MRASLTVTLLVLSTARIVAAQSKDVRDSIAALEARARADSTDAGTLVRLSMYYSMARRAQDWPRILDRALRIDPRNALALFAAADSPFVVRPRLRSEVRQNRIPKDWTGAAERAQRRARQAFLLDPFAAFRLAGVAADSGEANAPRSSGDEDDEDEPAPRRAGGVDAAGTHLRACLRSFAEAAYQKAFDACRLYAQLKYGAAVPDSVPSFVWWYRGMSAAHLGLFAEALRDFQALLDRSATREIADTLIPFQMRSADYRYLLAAESEAAHRPADALHFYQQAAAGDSAMFMAHVRLAALYRQFRMWPQAIEEQQRSIVANPDDPIALYELGVLLSEAGKPADAEQPLRQAMERDQLDPRIPYQLGVVEQTLSKPVEARAAFQRVVALGSKVYDRVTTDARQRLAALP